MDIMVPFKFVLTHIELFIGIFIVLILLLGIVFLWRMLNEKPQATSTSLDVNQLENTLKKLITQAQAVTGSAGAASAASAAAGVASAASGASGAGASGAAAAGSAGLDPAAMGRLQGLLAERDKAIADLQTSLTEAKKVAGTGNSEHALQLLEMQNKVRDLEARLAEYSIIEDDIADLSMYKEENVRLKREIQDLKGGGTAAASSAAPSIATEPDPVPTPEAAAQPSEPSVVEQFAAAVKEQSAPKVDAGKKVETAVADQEDPLGGTLDTSKMLEEMDGLKSEDAGDDVLADALDTDKLMSELGNFGSSPSPAASAGANAGGGADLNPEEDLFGEFKDEEKS